MKGVNEWKLKSKEDLGGMRAGTTCTVINFPYFYTYANRVRVTFFVPFVCTKCTKYESEWYS